MIGPLAAIPLVLAALFSPSPTSIRLILEMAVKEGREPSGHGLIYKHLVLRVRREEAQRWLANMQEGTGSVSFSILEAVEGVGPGPDQHRAGWMNRPEHLLERTQPVALMGLGTTHRSPLFFDWVTKMEALDLTFEGTPSEAHVEFKPGQPMVHFTMKFPWKPGLKPRKWHGMMPVREWTGVLTTVAS